MNWYKVVKSTYIVWPGLTMNSQVTLSMIWGTDYLYYYAGINGVNHIVDCWTPNATATHSFSTGTVPLLPVPFDTVKFLQFPGAWSAYNIGQVGWYTHLTDAEYMVNGSWINVPYAYSTNGAHSYLDYNFRWGEAAYNSVSAYYGPGYVHFSYNSQGITLPPDTLLWEPVGGGGSCPFVYTWDGQRFVMDNNLLPASEISNGVDVEDYYKLEQQLVPTYQGRTYSLYSLQIREFENEHDYLDQIKLLAVDHSLNVNVGVTPYGEILTYKNPTPPIYAVDQNGADVLPLLSVIDGNYYQGSNGSYVTISFAPTDISNGIKLVIRADRPPVLKSPVYVQVLHATGEWNTVATFHTRTYWATDMINMAGYLPDIEGNLKVRLSFVSNDKIDYIGIDTTPQEPIQIQEASPLLAFHSTHGIVTPLLKTNDQNYAELIPSELIQLTLLLPNNQNQKRTFILYTEGHYNPIT